MSSQRDLNSFSFPATMRHSSVALSRSIHRETTMSVPWDQFSQPGCRSQRAAHCIQRFTCMGVGLG